MTAIEFEKVCLVVSCTVNRKLYGIVVGKRTATVDFKQFPHYFSS